MTTSNVCSLESARIVRERFSNFAANARLVVLPMDVTVSRIGGLFGEMKDGSYLAFIALNNAGGSGENSGIVFSGRIAERFFNYFLSLAARD